ncbi:MAG: formimidoylglutamase [Balneolaceae bacterium]|nr:formimidoylglutamase [Balneolaceae bacterium]
MHTFGTIVEKVPTTLQQLSSHDPNDYWLVQEIGFSEEDYEKATHVLIGCPQDEGVQRNNGRAGAAEAPDKIRERLYRMQVSQNTDIKLYDAGNITFSSLEQSHIHLFKMVSQCLRDGKKVITLGGGNDLSYADASALTKVCGEISAINVDAHLDMRKADKMTSGTPYRQLIEQRLLKPGRFHEFGIRPESNGDFYLTDAEEMGVSIHYLSDILNTGVQKSFSKVISSMDQAPLFLGLDMDSVQAADAPGVSASSPIGFSAREMLEIVEEAKNHPQLKLFEITEVNPSFDVDHRTVKLAASLVWKYLFG